jgi:hypothetical protein
MRSTRTTRSEHGSIGAEQGDRRSKAFPAARHSAATRYVKQKRYRVERTKRGAEFEQENRGGVHYRGGVIHE